VNMITERMIQMFDLRQHLTDFFRCTPIFRDSKRKCLAISRKSEYRFWILYFFYLFLFEISCVLHIVSQIWVEEVNRMHLCADVLFVNITTVVLGLMKVLMDHREDFVLMYSQILVLDSYLQSEFIYYLILASVVLLVLNLTVLVLIILFNVQF